MDHTMQSSTKGRANSAHVTGNYQLSRMDVTANADASFSDLPDTQSNSREQNSITRIESEDVDHNPRTSFLFDPDKQKMVHYAQEQEQEPMQCDKENEDGLSIKPDESTSISTSATGFQPGNDVHPDGNNMDEEEILLAPDQTNINSNQPLKPDSERPSNSDIYQDLASDNTMLGPRAAEGNDYLLRPFAMFQSQTTQPYNSNTNQHPPHLTGVHTSGKPEGDGNTASISVPEATREVDVTDSTKLQQKKPRIKIKTGPRPKTAKEWFMKNRQEPQLSIPHITGVKRKRSENQHEVGHSRIQKAKIPRGALPAKKKKKGQNGISLKVMGDMLKSLQDSNPIEARIGFGDLPEAGPIIAATKEDQFQQIMKSLPKDADKRSAAADKRKLDEATRSFGYGNCVAKDGKWLIKGMKTPLHAHQVIGASWMLKREFCEDGPRGGIVADEMGMGKTLETLACIVSNRPTAEDIKEYGETTLVIAPATAIKQWEEEIKKHVDSDYIDSEGAILHYKSSKEIPMRALKTMHIILASYQEISMHAPSPKFKANLENNYRHEQGRQKHYNKKLGLLFKIPFWRVVLDEGHNIKNRQSQTSIACQNLKGLHRWALSGTPITNSLDEIYPYLKFLKVNGVGDPKDFRYLYSNTEDASAMNELSTMMNTIMLRRTMKDSFMGRPLYEIPKPHYDIRRVRLTKEERIIYSVLEERFRGVINDVLEKVQARGRQVRLKDIEGLCLLLFTRLRQSVAHPFLLETTMKEELKPEDLLEIRRRLQEVKGGQHVFQRIGKWCGEKAIVIKDEKDDDDPESTFGNSQFGYEFNMDKQLSLALASQNKDLCRICYQEPNDPQTVKCEHVFCRQCIEDHWRNEFKDGRMIPKCPDCNKSLTLYEPVEQSDAEHKDTQGSTTPRGGWKLGRDSLNKHPKFQCKFLQQSDQAHPEPVLPSAKTTAIKDAIIKWRLEAPDDKIIIFTSFKMTCAILGRMLKAEGISFVYFIGDLASAEKENAIRAFKEKKEIQVMIASLGCGAVGLNLMIANRVIIVDLWWNHAIEMQAFGRVFRIGQEKETHFLRIVAENTIDNRIEALQAQKKENISKIMEPGEKWKPSTEEMVSLFGRVKKSANGKLAVLPYGDESELDEESDDSEEAEEDNDV
ncbi:SNF2 family N-terminal domain-containing protein [Xylaria telfairii]|nr:SNF2 family N-terminal domain-containing protein [Xylaria telfairii]